MTDATPDAAIGADVVAPSPVSAVWRSPDVVLVALAFLPAVALGASESGYVFGGGGWILQRMLALLDSRWIGKTVDPVKRLTLNLFEAFGRIWLLAGVIVLAAVVGIRQDGLTAAVVILLAYSVDFVFRIATRPRRSGTAK